MRFYIGRMKTFTIPVSADCTCALGPVTTMIEDCWSLLGTFMFTS